MLTKINNAAHINKRNKKKGFTLIELIVVIAILAIIAALALPAFNNLRAQSAQRVADGNARTVYTAAVAALAMTDNQTAAATIADENGTADDGYAGEVNALLGANFFADGGTYGVTITDGAVTATSWTGTIDGRADLVGNYPQAETEEP